MREKVLGLLRDNARLSDAEIALRLDLSETDVADIINQLEQENIVRGYQAVVDESSLKQAQVRAIIDVKVTPERDGGFNRVARRISRFEEVDAVYLVSGGCDLQLEVQGETLQNVAFFVSSKLATIEGVTSTATHFILKKYKESGKLLHDGEEYERLKVTP